LDKRKVVNNCISLETPAGGDETDGVTRTIGHMIESDDNLEDITADYAAISLVQSYINRNKVLEAILLDNIAFNDVQRYYKQTIKTKNFDGEDVRYVEHSSEFWPYRLVQIVSKLPESYKREFLARYTISEEKLDAVLQVVDKANNQKLYRYLDKTLTELRTTYAF
jgi:hypothetical protein